MGNDKGWRLSPAYDLTPTDISYNARAHRLAFDNKQTKPSMELCIEVADKVGVDKQLKTLSLNRMLDILNNWRNTAKRLGIQESELKRFEVSFEHEGIEKLKSLTHDKSKQQSMGR